jgi:hypothetical protein
MNTLNKEIIKPYTAILVIYNTLKRITLSPVFLLDVYLTKHEEKHSKPNCVKTRNGGVLYVFKKRKPTDGTIIGKSLVFCR